MEQNSYNLWLLVLQIGTIIAASVFALWQVLINKRLKELQDYVAISIIPKQDFQLQIMNVGKINLYVHKWDIGTFTETFSRAILIPAAAPSFLLISLSSPPMGQHPVKIYLTDESGKKYLSTGEVVIEPIAIRPLSQILSRPESAPSGEGTQTSGSPQTQVVNIMVRMRAWSYKTEKYNWTI